MSRAYQLFYWTICATSALAVAANLAVFCGNPGRETSPSLIMAVIISFGSVHAIRLWHKDRSTRDRR